MMWKKFKKVLFIIQTEAGEYSINRVVPFWILVVFTMLMVGITVCAVALNRKFDHYNDLCMLYLGVIFTCGTWIQGNKITNSIWNTQAGSAGKPNLVSTGASAVSKLASAINSDKNREV